MSMSAPARARAAPASGPLPFGPAPEPRRRFMSRDMIEKSFLHKRSARTPGKAHISPPRASRSKVLETEEKSALYISERERFSTDAAAEERHERELRAQARAAALERRREEMQAREATRQRQMEESKAREHERVERLREEGLKAKRNKGSIPYNLITLDYNDSLDGLRQQHCDDQLKYRAEVRKARLHWRNNSVINPITGERGLTIAVPPRPSTPPQLKGVPETFRR